MERVEIRSREYRGTAAEMTSANPVLLFSEKGIETDTTKWKMGDGVTHWNDLGYQGAAVTDTSEAELLGWLI